MSFYYSELFFGWNNKEFAEYLLSSYLEENKDYVLFYYWNNEDVIFYLSSVYLGVNKASFIFCYANNDLLTVNLLLSYLI